MPISPAEQAAEQQLKNLIAQTHVPIVARNYATERERFLVQRTGNPAFVYSVVKRDQRQILTTLDSVVFPETPYGQLLAQKADELRSRVRFASAPDVETATNASVALFGRPSREVLERARGVVDKYRGKMEHVGSLSLEAVTIVETLTRALANLGLSHWKVLASHRPSQGLAINAAKKEIHVQQGKTLTLETLPMIVVHEIETHVLCGENGGAQVGWLLASGCSGWLTTQEGLAAYNVLTQFPEESDRPMFHWAVRTLAVDWALKADFRTVFSNLVDCGLSPDYAFATTYKVKRGLPRTDQPGAYARDHIYFSGLEKVEAYVRAGGTITDLYIGRVALESLETISDLDWVRPPKFVPTFLRSRPGQ